jgi:GntR family transcriptional repressor for pyruvate dehydrogenase complex
MIPVTVGKPKSMNYTTVKRNSTPELVMKQILESIESGQLKPGDRLPTEQQMIEMFGVGRSTIREATATLSMLGYLRSVQGKGCFVRDDLDPVKATGLALQDMQAATNIIDLVEVREIMECNAVRLAARRADLEDIDRIQSAFLKMKATMNDLNRFIEHDFEFHIALARSTGNQLILEMMKRIVEKVHKEYDKFRPNALFKRDLAVVTAEQIADFVANGEGEKAAASMQEHLNLVTTEIKRKLPEFKWIKKKL